MCLGDVCGCLQPALQEAPGRILACPPGSQQSTYCPSGRALLLISQINREEGHPSPLCSLCSLDSEFHVGDAGGWSSVRTGCDWPSHSLNHGQHNTAQALPATHSHPASCHTWRPGWCSVPSHWHPTPAIPSWVVGATQLLLSDRKDSAQAAKS